MREDFIGQIAAKRGRNNGLWMRLLEIALRSAPKETKVVLREINMNDRAISELLEKIAE
jgi:hypothetical protein